MTETRISPRPQPPPETRRSWFGRHKVWTAVLVFVLLAVATGAVLCTIL